MGVILWGHVYAALSAHFIFFGASDTLTRSPFGIRMCQRLCSNVVGCSTYLYSSTKHLCRLKASVNDKPSPDEVAYNVNITRDRDPSMCPHFARGFYDRKHHWHCETMQKEVDAINGKQELFNNKTRLLVWHFYAKRKIVQVNLQNMSVQKEPYLTIRFMGAMAYDSSLKTVLVAKQQQILSYPLDKDVGTVLFTGINVCGMAVDESRQLIFVSTRNRTVVVMTTKGKQFHVILHRQHFKRVPISIALDPERTMMYVNCQKYVVFSTYKAENVTKLQANSAVFSLSYDNKRHVVYALDGQAVMQISDSLKYETVIKLSNRPCSVSYHSDRIYVFSDLGTDVYAMKGEEVYPYKNISMKLRCRRLIVCFVW